MHKRLAKIELDTIATAIVASAYTDSLNQDSFLGILETTFDLQISTPLVPDVHLWFYVNITSSQYLPTSDAMYRELLLEFLGDSV